VAAVVADTPWVAAGADVPSAVAADAVSAAGTVAHIAVVMDMVDMVVAAMDTAVTVAASATVTA